MKNVVNLHGKQVEIKGFKFEPMFVVWQTLWTFCGRCRRSKWPFAFVRSTTANWRETAIALSICPTTPPLVWPSGLYFLPKLDVTRFVTIVYWIRNGWRGERKWKVGWGKG